MNSEKDASPVVGSVTFTLSLPVISSLSLFLPAALIGLLVAVATERLGNFSFLIADCCNLF